MGGKGSGGRRAGAGRKPKDAALRALDGNARRQKVVRHPSVPPQAPVPPSAGIAVDEEHAPDELTLEERQVWVKLAPLARDNGTLTRETELMFLRLCRHVVIEREYGKSVQERGGANHRGMIQRVDAELGDFKLRAFGKAAAGSAEKPARDPMQEKYFGGR